MLALKNEAEIIANYLVTLCIFTKTTIVAKELFVSFISTNMDWKTNCQGGNIQEFAFQSLSMSSFTNILKHKRLIIIHFSDKHNSKHWHQKRICQCLWWELVGWVILTFSYNLLQNVEIIFLGGATQTAQLVLSYELEKLVETQRWRERQKRSIMQQFLSHGWLTLRPLRLTFAT